MTTQNDTLRSLTLDVIGNYRKTAKFATKALVATSARSFSKADAMLTSYAGTKLGAPIKRVLDAGQEKILLVTQKTDAAIDTASDKVKKSLLVTESAIASAATKTDSAVENWLNGASHQIAKFPPKGGKLAAVLKNDAIKTLETVGLPGAKLARLVSATLASGAEQLSVKVTGAKTRTARTGAKAAKKPARKTTTARSRARRASAK